MCVQSECMCLRRITTIKVIFKTWLSLWVLACLKQWSYNKTQLLNDQIRCLCQKSLKQAFWRYLKRFRTSFFCGKQCLSSMNFWRYLRRLGNAEFIFENNDSRAWIMMVSIWNDLVLQRNFKKACHLTVFETIWKCREKWKQCL